VLSLQVEVVGERRALDERRAEVFGELKKQQQRIYNSELLNTRPSCTLSTSSEAGAALERASWKFTSTNLVTARCQNYSRRAVRFYDWLT
jgi:hypothetical protein